MISCAVLVALIISNTSLILMWHEDATNPESTLVECLLLVFHAAALINAVTATRFLDSAPGVFVAALASCVMFASAYGVYKLCPRAERFGGKRQHYHGDQVKTDSGYFVTPLLPFWPCIGIFVNYYLVAQLDFGGVAGLLSFWLLVIAYYFFFAVQHSIGGNAEWTGIAKDDKLQQGLPNEKTGLCHGPP
jgi:hypothetical protein